jgi:hypothetical protein
MTTGPTQLDNRPRYRWRVVPDPGRFPRRWWHWWRLAALVMVVVLVLAGLTRISYVTQRWGCLPGGWFSSTVRSQDGECVGLSDGGYDFEQAKLAPVFAQLKKQNDAADDACSGPAVTVGVLLTLTSDNTGGRAQSELEGFVATQRRLNATPGCSRGIRLLVGHTGRDQQAAVRTAGDLADAGVVAVVGMGLSDPQAARAANSLADRVPMVADLITSEGFDENGFQKSPKLDFSRCEDSQDYRDGVGRGWFFRVSFRISEQVKRLHDLSGGKADFLIQPLSPKDPSTCTQIPYFRATFTGERLLTFNPADSKATLSAPIARICDRRGDVTVVYAARARDAGLFLTQLDESLRSDNCEPRRVTVLMTSDASRLRAVDVDPRREAVRRTVLASPTVASGQVRLIATPLAVPEAMEGPALQAFRQNFEAAGFDPAHVDDGWAINAHDALATVWDAVDGLPASEAGTPIQVHARITNFSGEPVPSVIQAPLRFDGVGNRVGTPTAVRICPLAPPRPGETTPRTTVVTVKGDTVPACPAR